MLYRYEIDPSEADSPLNLHGRCWRPDLHLEIALFLARLTEAQDMCCAGFGVGAKGEFLAFFDVPPAGYPDRRIRITYRLEHGGSSISNGRRRFLADRIVPLNSQHLLEAADAAV